MTNASRIKIAALTTALALGGLTAAGLVARGGEDVPIGASTTAAETAQKPVVVHRREVKTVVVKPGSGEPVGTELAAGVPGRTGAATVTVHESLGDQRSDDDDGYGGEDERDDEADEDD